MQIKYNALNLPCKVTFGNGGTVTYLYSADGTKLRTVHTVGGVSTTTDYLGNVVYEDGSPKLLLKDAGYVSLSDGKYHYYLKDHQGNNRVVIASNGTVEEVNHYYPFGGVFASSGDVQPYKYNGKELDRKGGLDWYDYGARHYDAALGRFLTVDPMAQKYWQWSPYAYCLDNPVRYVDPDGLSTQIPPMDRWSREKIQRFYEYSDAAASAGREIIQEAKISVSTPIGWKGKVSIGEIGAGVEVNVGPTIEYDIIQGTIQPTFTVSEVNANLDLPGFDLNTQAAIEIEKNIETGKADLNGDLSASLHVSQFSVVNDGSATLETAVQAGPIGASVVVNLKALGEWIVNGAKALKELIIPEVNIQVPMDERNIDNRYP